MTKISMHISTKMYVRTGQSGIQRVNHPQVHVEQFGLSRMCLECDLNQEQ